MIKERISLINHKTSAGKRAYRCVNFCVVTVTPIRIRLGQRNEMVNKTTAMRIILLISSKQLTHPLQSG